MTQYVWTEEPDSPYQTKGLQFGDGVLLFRRIQGPGNWVNFAINLLLSQHGSEASGTGIRMKYEV